MMKNIMRIISVLVAVGVGTYIVMAKGSKKKINFPVKNSKYCKKLEKQIEDDFLSSSKSGVPNFGLEKKFKEDCKDQEKEPSHKSNP